MSSRAPTTDPPLVLGFNSTHDAAAAIVRGADVLMAVEEERLSRVKHHFGTPTQAMELCLRSAASSWGELEHAAFYMNPGLWLRSFGWHFVRNLPGSASYLGRKPALWRSFLGIERNFRQATGFRGKFHAVDHHAAHIDSAFWPSGFEEAAALTVDGAGESATTVLARVDERGQKRQLTLHYPISLGKVWEALTDWLGWRPTQDEGKLMGLAPYGTDRFVSRFREIVHADEAAGIAIDFDYFLYQVGGARLVSPKFEGVFGAARTGDGPIEDHHRDVAYALQAVTDEIVLALARRVREWTGLPRLVMAGGVALNCVTNGRLLESGLFDDVFVQPAAGDNGASLGAALFVNHRKLGAERGLPQRHAYLGPGFTDAEVVAAGEAADVVELACDDPVERAADLLADGAVIGWMQGRMEYGPRALGNRSILADPRSTETAERVNRLVKFREPFRPFAPSVTLEDAADWFEGARPSPYMLLAFPVRKERREQIPAVTHVDGSARLQTVTADENPMYHALLRAFADRTGVPVLLNTSFNIRGEPIVQTPDEAMQALVRTGLTHLVIGSRIFTKQG